MYPDPEASQPSLFLESEFLAEAQELVDGVSRTLLALDEARGRGDGSPLLLGDVFRAVHTLKGLAGLFRPGLLATLAHELEELLQDLRLGRASLDAATMDLLFRGVEGFGALLTAVEAGTPEPEPEIRALLSALTHGRHALDRPPGAEGAPLESWALDPQILAVLTEYEEHRLRLAVASGQRLFRAELKFPLATLDEGLEHLKAQLAELGEIVTYLPTGDGADLASIELSVLVVSRAPYEVLAAAFAPLGAALLEVRRRDETLPPAPPDPADPEGPPPLVLAAPALPADGDAPKERTATVRVAIERIDGLLDVTGELGLLPFAFARLEGALRARPELRREVSELSRLRRALERQIGRLRGGILATRLVPLGQVVERVGRAVRQAAREVDKQVTFVATGVETELDKMLVEELLDPLLHLVRNAVDHGIEDRATRERLRKPVVGTLALNAFQKGSQVVVELEDDGAGMDPAALVARAEALGLLPEDGPTGKADALALVFLPGFTTRQAAGPLSGRGVGMDVVRTKIAALGGTVEVQSERDIGTKFTLTLPISLAVLQVLVVVDGGVTYCLPLAAVEEVFPLDPEALRSAPPSRPGGAVSVVLPHRGAALPCAPLARAVHGGACEGPPRSGYVVLVALPGVRVAVVVARVEGQQGIVVKGLPAILAGAGEILAGAADLGDHRIGLVVDVGPLANELARGRTRWEEVRP